MPSLITSLQKVVGLSTSGADLIKLANKARDEKKYSEAAQFYKAYLVKNPTNASIHIQAGHMCKEAGQFDEAGRHYFIAYALSPEDADLNVQIGHYYKVIGKLDDALPYYKRAVELGPDSDDARSELSKALALAKAHPPAGSATARSGVPPVPGPAPVSGSEARALSEPGYRQPTYITEPSMTSLLEREALVGYFDSFEEGVARGWAYDGNEPLKSLTLQVVVDGRDVGMLKCDQYRADIQQNLSHPTGLVGFTYEVPLTFFDGASHTVGFRFHNRKVVGFFQSNQPEITRDVLRFEGKLRAKIEGVVDGLYQGHLQGWAVRQEARAPSAHGGCTIVVTCDGVRVAQARADRWRGDVANQRQADPNCGFRIQIPDAFRKAYPQTFRLHVMPENVEVSNSPYTTTVLYDHLEATFAEVATTTDRLAAEIASLRSYITKLRVLPGQTIEEYDGWARKYYADLKRRVASGRAAPGTSGQNLFEPLVSVLLPTYKPLLTDFSAAVQSVLDQTYQKWELIIVDDASRQTQLTELIEKFCQLDPRIRAVTRTENGNISEATNTAVAAARGEWIAFFDHDDLLVDEALEVMVNHSRQIDAKVMYSDEDKIDQVGYYSEPNLKPDWNHRFILGCNYVCHLLLVRKEVLELVGPLRTECNGAQDHDIVLRISEHVPANQIYHVPELLYHWRKTPNSTAVTISNKGYAVKAGVTAVGDHLKRLKKKASVRSIDGLTIYGVDWLYDAHPTVCIIIPFRDHVTMTQLCLDRVLQNTDWPDLEIILVNNWSIQQETLDFIEEAEKIPGVRVLHVEEDFNYSRLNNLAAATTEAEFLVFMNNDLLVKQKDWLRLIVNEAMADDDVAIVGGKLVYPNGSIQHAGLVVNPVEIGAYLHHGARQNDYGYTGRARLPHELTAVTAACMLIRAEIFHAVGRFDEENLKVAYNDIDLCLKVRQSGKKVIFAANFVAEHHESYSRGSDDRPENEMRFLQEKQALLDRWGNSVLFQNDPAYNPHFLSKGRKFFDLVPIVS